jgi:hypothetical protein
MRSSTVVPAVGGIMTMSITAEIILAAPDLIRPYGIAAARNVEPSAIAVVRLRVDWKKAHR